jgi:thioredoxin reductase (NADPH)
MTNVEDVIVVGAGPVGLACAISAKRRGFDPLVIDAGAIVNSIVHYPIQMGFFTSPELMEIGGHPLVCAAAKPTREEGMMYYRGVARTEGLRVRTYTQLLTARRANDSIVASVRGLDGDEELHCHKLILATGYYDNPRMLNVPGEDIPRVRHYFDEAHLSTGLDVAVIGGKNSAVEAALLLHRAWARVTMIVRGPTLGETLKYWVRPDIENRIKAGEIAVRYSAKVEAFTPRTVKIRSADGSEESIAADRVYALVGFLPDTNLFRRIGIEIDPTTGKPSLNPENLESNVPGVHPAGSICAGFRTSDIFIENGRHDGERIFSSAATAR